MSEQVLQISIRIKELRQICEYTVEQAARAAGVPVEVYLDYEEGRADIPHKRALCPGRLFITSSLPPFFLPGATRICTNTRWCAKGDGVEINRRKAYKYNSLAYKFIGKRMEPLFVTAPPEKTTSP